LPRRLTARDRFRYAFDNTMARGPVALMGWLLLASLALIALFTLIVIAAGLDPSGRGAPDVAWAGLMRAMDAGAMGGDEGSWPFLFATLGLTLGGIFVVSTLIGLLTTGIEGKLESLRKGRSFVAAEGHTVILGWSSQVFTVVSEIVLANENQRRATIAILAEEDAGDMMDALRDRIPDWKTTRIVCRTGSPIDPADLALVNPNAARAIVVLAPETDDPDASVIKTVLALTNGPDRKDGRYHIVAVVRDRKNAGVARMVGRDEVHLILSGDLIARVTAQTCRQSGLSVAYTELLDFGGDEIYFTTEPALDGKPYGDALAAYQTSAVMGVRSRDGRIRLNPPGDTRLAPGDALIVISEDDDTIRLGPGPVSVDEAAIRTAPPRASLPERTLMLGWNARAGDILRELSQYVPDGSSALIVAGDDALDEAAGTPVAGALTLAVQAGDTTDRTVLDALDVATFDHLIVLSDAAAADPQQADARTLITLLHLRDIADRQSLDLSIVSEMLDVRNRDLAQVTRADDFIVSDRLVSLMLSQVAENRDLGAVFDDLFDPEGSEIYLKPAADYVEAGRPVTFYTVVEAARRRGQTAIGYRRQAQAHDAGAAFGVVVNPDKALTVTFADDDRVIVLAED
jgi:Trk K+ transport system NAD-binding subunit